MTTKMDEAFTIELTTRYLVSQKWALVSGDVLGREIWQEVSQWVQLSAEQLKKEVERQVWQKYGALMHNSCLEPATPLYQQAWEEVAQFMAQKIAPTLFSLPHQQEELVQYSLQKLQKKLETEPLNSPKAFFAFISQLMLRERTDLHRLQTAQKRGGESGDDYIEELEAKDIAWEHKTTEKRYSPENEVTEAEINHQLNLFFKQHLPTDLQYKVAVAHFIDGLEPGEIAVLLGKPAHEIRLVKARIVQKLRSLSGEEQAMLYRILGIEGGGSHG